MGSLGGKKFVLAAGEALKLYSDLLQAEKEGTFVSPGLQPGRTLYFCACSVHLQV